MGSLMHPLSRVRRRESDSEVMMREYLLGLV
jgi:hypothetical protein